MRVLHKEIAVANNSDLAMLATAMDSDALAKNVAIPDRDPTRPARVAEVLRLVADDYIWMEHVALPDFGIAEDRNVTDQAGTRTNPDAPVEHTERAYGDSVGQLDITGDYRTRMYSRTRMYNYAGVSMGIGIGGGGFTHVHRAPVGLIAQ
jgi:hypothetical protein